MATTKGRSRRKSTGSRSTAASKGTGTKRKSNGAAKNNSGRKNQQQQPDLTPEILLFAIVLVLIVVALCTYGVVPGTVGEGIRNLVLGVFGTIGFILPPILVFVVFWGNRLPDTLRFKISSLMMTFIIGILCEYFVGNDLNELTELAEGRAKIFYEAGKGGGVLFGFPALWVYRLFGGKVIPILLLILIAIFCVLTMFQLSFFGTVAAIAEKLGNTAEELREVPRRYGPDEEAIEARKERRTARMREYDDDRERRIKQKEEAQARREEEERRREEVRLAEDERRAEAARARLEREEAARAAFEEKKARREEERIRRKEAEERAEDQRILNASRPASAKKEEPARPNFVAATLQESRHTSPDEMHEITLPRIAGAVHNVSGTEMSGMTDVSSVSSENTEPGIPEEHKTSEEAVSERSVRNDHVDSETEAGNVLLQNMPKPVTERSRVLTTDSADPENPTGGPENDAADAAEISDSNGKRENDHKVIESSFDEADKSIELKPENSGIDHNLKTGSALEKAGSDKKNQESVISGKKENGKKPLPRKYERPPISLLNKSEKKHSGDSDEYLQKTALQLVETLQSFGVTATVSGISQGPSVTRFELEPAPGTKVNKIVGLADDLKLGLAAQDIRIEAPIPGKQAVGIEIPNKETTSVSIRDLIESTEFKNAGSKISYAVGKDISGQVIVSDIAKMPHLLVAGATGSGKSVFINTLIMSILYEADPDEVKLIMVDPKFVELSVYNGIPHLLLPVVTDPRQANAALAWAVGEMTRRYRLFETNKVRGLPAFNEMVDAGTAQVLNENEEVKRLPQIVVIVDELADLMMVASKDVEESICRLAQLARAAGIHLVIATQRPSVNVITGLIKANMPSRIAFKVSSGIDSRTILDMVGAERLLGLGDMLFAPQNLNKPLRVQGAFVSDAEVTKVVDFLKKNAGEEVYDEKIVSSISRLSQGEEAENAEKTPRSGNSGDYDSMFDEVARYVVEKEKASSTMLQRVYKISYNRAVRIIDQLEKSGVIGAEAGTKPRNVLMNMAQLEEFLQHKAET